MRNQGLSRVVDVYALREGFARAAGDYDDPAGVRAFLTAAREFENLMTYYYPEYPENWVHNRKVTSGIVDKLNEVAARAFALDAAAVVLPVPAESPLAAVVGRILREDRLSLPVQVLLPVR